MDQKFPASRSVLICLLLFYLWLVGNQIKDYKDILRYNNYVDDKYSDNNPWNAICSRGDLR